ncbi:MAG: lysoplasmalogenase [Proteobacteria bacterium]|nr:lysoplasmalogenase [Pseudomonadota bacterium]
MSEVKAARYSALFLAALLAGLTYWPASDLPFDPVLLVVWKGAGVGLLALWAGLRARSRDGWLLTAVMSFGALGDVLLEAVSLQLGALAFLAGHIVAILLYMQNRRAGVHWLWLMLVPVVVLAGALLPDDRTAAPGIAVYSLGLGAMAATALMSRFRRAAIGAWMFVASDLLIFARLGPLADSFIPDLLIWPLYFAGQAMIAWDVDRNLHAGEA